MAKLLTRTAPLRIHLSALIMALLAGVALPLIFLAHERGEAEAARSAVMRMDILAERAAERYRAMFGGAHSVVRLAAVSEALSTPPPVALGFKTAFLSTALASSPHLDSVFAAYPNGSFIQAVSLENSPSWREMLDAPADANVALRLIVQTDQGAPSSFWQFIGADGRTIAEHRTLEARYDPRARPWYRAAAAAPGPVVLGPAVMPMSGQFAMSVSERHRNHADVVVGTDILLEAIRRFLAEERVSPGGKAFVFDAEGSLIVQTDETTAEPARGERGKRGEFRARAAAQGPFLAAVTAAIAQRSGESDEVMRFSHAGAQFIGRVSPIPISSQTSGERIVIVAPLSDFTAESERFLTHGLIISGLLLIAGLILTLVSSGLITRSLSALTAEAQHLGDLDFEKSPAASSRIKEINTLAAALASARDAIKTFALYVPRELVRKVIASGQFAERGATRQEVTVLFTDIKDFTTISEQNSPEDVVHALSAYFDLMNKGVEENGGSIVQFLGDSVYAMWNAPIADPDHAVHGCQCAIDLAGAVAEFNRTRQEAGLPQFATRFGLHTGQAVVGSVGAEKRLQYTAMGDTVNVASRLEGINKEFGTTILVSAAVEQRCRGSFAFRPLGRHKAKGRAEAIEIFELTATLSSSGEAKPRPGEPVRRQLSNS